jgi:hypothetical protein
VQASRAVAAMMRTLLPALGHSPAEDCQVLTPGHKGPLGVSRRFHRGMDRSTLAGICLCHACACHGITEWTRPGQAQRLNEMLRPILNPGGWRHAQVGGIRLRP